MDRSSDYEDRREAGLSIGVLARRTGTKVETIRFYERAGLLPPPPRSRGGHRVYDGEQLKRLNFVRRSRGLGFTLDQVRELLRFVDGTDYGCADVQALTASHLDRVRSKIADLRKIEKVLKRMAESCRRGDLPDCPIIDALFDQAGGASN